MAAIWQWRCSGVLFLFSASRPQVPQNDHVTNAIKSAAPAGNPAGSPRAFMRIMRSFVS